MVKTNETKQSKRKKQNYKDTYFQSNIRDKKVNEAKYYNTPNNI